MTISKQDLQSPSGFPDLSPGVAIQQNRMLDVIRRHYELAGFVPIETPLVERTQVLSLKSGGEIKNQIYGLRLLNPDAESTDDSKDLALRFDQTVPLARYVSANMGSLFFPFRRYVIGPVFRGEKPKDGRYRQFIQADIDVIGNETLNLFNDAEMVGVIVGIFKELSIGEFTVRLGHRKILKGFFQSMGLETLEEQSRASVIIDKLEKVGEEKVIEMLGTLGVSQDKAEGLIKILTLALPVSEYLAYLQGQKLGELYEEGVRELSEIVTSVRSLGVEEDCFAIDLSIVRGLEYYTGIVYETRFDAYPGLGSIASGGRYDNLAESFSNRPMPGVGISIGVTRLLLRLVKAGLISADVTTVAKVFVTTAEGIAENAPHYLRLGSTLRGAGIATEVYMVDRNLGKQMQYADKRGFTVVVIARKEDLDAGKVVLRNMRTGDQVQVPETELVSTVKSILGE